jgi:tetratricopeptide (TPR) repeat protein
MVCSFSIILVTGCSREAERIRNARRFISEWNYDRALMEVLNYRNSNNPEIQYIIGYCYLRKNEYDEAAKYFQQSLAIDTVYRDTIIRIYTNIARNAVKIGDLDKALFLYQELAKTTPGFEQAQNLFLMGDMNFEQGNFPAAAMAYRRAIEIDSSSAASKKARRKLIKALVECDSIELAYELARKEYDRSKIAENVLQLGEIMFALGKRLFESGRIDSAKSFFKAMVEHQEPKSLLDETYFYIGEIYLQQDSSAAALEAYKRVLKLNPYQKGEFVRRARMRIEELKGNK